MCTTSHHICRHDKKIIKLLKNKNFKIEIEKTIQFSIFWAKIGGESKSNSRYHIDCKKKQGRKNNSIFNLLSKNRRRIEI